MTNITLYIAGRKVDLSDDSLVLMNYAFSDLSNPMAVKNSYSKSISLEGTDNNNDIFGHIWRIDRKTIYGDGFTGVEFDATRKTPFKIYNGQSEVIVSGYCKLSSVTMEEGHIKYSLNLYGGIGSFFYNIAYNPDGSKKTLADLSFYTGDSSQFKPFGKFSVTDEYPLYEVLEAWDSLGGTIYPDKLWNAINFAVCYEGIPEDFDAQHAVGNRDRFLELSNADNVNSFYAQGAHSALLTFERPHLGWDLRELRWYMLRPVVSIKEIFHALENMANTNGAKFIYTDGVDREIHDLWVTLPLVAKGDRNNEDCIINVLKQTPSPLDYLLGVAKYFGFVFVTGVDGVVKAMTRKEFFAFAESDVIDMTDRIDSRSLTFSPNLADHRFYQMGGAKPVLGEWAQLYAREYGREYGTQVINTGYDFDLETNILTKDNPFAEGASVVQKNKLYYLNIYGGEEDILNLPDWEKVTETLYKSDRKTPIESKIRGNYYIKAYFNTTFYGDEGWDWRNMLQLHDSEGKQIKGENILVRFFGMDTRPTVKYFDEISRVVPYYLTADTPDMNILVKKPCWNFSATNFVSVDKLPYFSRFRYNPLSKNRNITDSLSFGIPSAESVPSVRLQYGGIYERNWKKYLTDRYDTDTKVMKCKANLRGINVDEYLLGRFFYYGGAIWVLNKITDYSLTTDDLTTCEFIKVKDKDNYTR